MHNIKRHVPSLAYSALVPYTTIGKGGSACSSGRVGSGGVGDGGLSAYRYFFCIYGTLFQYYSWFWKGSHVKK